MSARADRQHLCSPPGDVPACARGLGEDREIPVTPMVVMTRPDFSASRRLRAEVLLDAEVHARAAPLRVWAMPRAHDVLGGIAVDPLASKRTWPRVFHHRHTAGASVLPAPLATRMV